MHFKNKPIPQYASFWFTEVIITARKGVGYMISRVPSNSAVNLHFLFFFFLKEDSAIQPLSGAV